MNQNSLPDRFLINRSDIQEICEKYIKSHKLDSSILSLVFAGLGAVLSAFVTDRSIYKTSVFWIVLSIVIVLGIGLFILRRSRYSKNRIDLFDRIYETVLKESDYTGLFLVLRKSPSETKGKLVMRSVMTEKHKSDDFVLYIKNLQRFEHNGKLDYGEVKDAFAEKVTGLNPDLIEISYIKEFREIKRTSSDGREKMIRYAIFSVSAIDSLQREFEDEKHNYKWRTLVSLLEDEKNKGYNYDLIQEISQVVKKVDDTFYSNNALEPIKIIWNMTKNCKYNCDICATHSDRLELNENEKYRALLNILSIGLQQIGKIDFSGGDPLLNIEDIDIILKAQRVLGKDKVSVTTTGEGISFAESNCKEYFRDLIYNCEVTVDEIEEISNYIRKEGSYYSKNRLSIRRNSKYIEGHLVINVPILRPDMSDESIENLVRTISELDVSDKSCTLIRLMKTGKMINGYPTNYDPMHFIETFKKYADKQNLIVHVQCALRGANEANACTMLDKKIGIDCAGNVFACAWGGYVTEDIETNPFYLGNVFKQDLNTILKGEKALQIKDKLEREKATGSCCIFNYFEDNNHFITCDKDPLLRGKYDK